MIPVLMDVVALRAMRGAVLLLALVALAGCGSADAGDDADARTVVAGFYPLAWAVEQVASPAVDEVVNLTPPGAEPHDLELSPRDLETVDDAELVVSSAAASSPRSRMP